MSENKVERVDFDMDADLSEVADLINFVNPVPGRHIYTIDFAGQDKIGKDEEATMGIKLLYQKISTVEKAKENDPDTPDGSVFSENFTGNQKGKEFLKARLKQMYGEVEGSFRPYIESLMENRQQIQLELTTSIVISTSNGNTYENVRINNIEVLETPVDLPDGYKPFNYEPKID